MNANLKFSQDVISQMKNDVQEANGNEVFWAGFIDENGLVTGVEVGSRGNEDSVVINKDRARKAHVLIHNHPNGYIEPSEQDQNIAMNATDTSLGFYIVDNEISRVYVVVEPIKSVKTVKLDVEKTAFYLSEKGPFALKNKSYEARPSQIELEKRIANAFNLNQIGVFEAGTGVGKSFAYLIPSILWALENKERVIISTGTINLQQQLFEKDIPEASKILGKSVKAVLLKGRQNYLCLRRLDDASLERDLFSEETELFDSIYAWSKETKTGSKSDLSFVPPDSVWTKVNSESDACMGSRCPFREKCFVMKVRKEASDANLLVVNHHLLFADIESRMSGVGYEDTAVLPPYKRVIFDEAHGIEDSATSFFSESLTKFKVTKQLNLLYRHYKGNRAGFLVQCMVLSNIPDILEKTISAIEELKEALIELDDIGLMTLDTDYNARISSQNFKKFSRVFSAMKKFSLKLNVFCSVVHDVLESIEDDDKEIKFVWETKTVLRRLEDIATLCKNFLEWEEHEDTVFWLQYVKLPPKKAGDDFISFVQFNQTPLDIAPLMNKGVFEPLNTVVCTSATLRTDGNFKYWANRVGVSFVEEERLSQGVFESPFPYSKNVLFAVPNDAPFPKTEYFQQYVEATVPRLIFAAGGRTLVLFTSYDSLKHTYNNTRTSLYNAGLTVLKQGDDDRFRILEKFKSDVTSVLFATDSFWEGVDVPGESLSQVIIVKLPFSVPNDPVFQARSEAIEKNGGSSFFQLSVPEAVIKFRQGFGRLVRRSSDKGVITVLDRRIVENGYGKMFTKSVPMTRRMYNPLEDIIKAIEKIFEN